MRTKTGADDGFADEYLQVQVPSTVKHQLAIRAAEERQPIRVVVLRALKAYGIKVPEKAISDRRKRRQT